MQPVAKLALAAVALLAACAPLQIYYKEGETVARLDQALTGCEVKALAQVPKDIRRRYVPPTYAPYQVCNGTSCYWRQRILSPGHYEQYDANLVLRGKVTDQCMAALGYGQAKIPPCDTATARATPLRATKVLPPLSQKSCAIRLKSGRWQIVTPDAG